MKIEGKVFVVTGGGNGIGRELVLLLLQKGARVAAVDISEEALRGTVELAGSHPLAGSIASSFPPCTLTVFEFPAESWHEAAKKNANFSFLLFPRD